MGHWTSERELRPSARRGRWGTWRGPPTRLGKGWEGGWEFRSRALGRWSAAARASQVGASFASVLGATARGWGHGGVHIDEGHAGGEDGPGRGVVQGSGAAVGG